MAIQHYTDHAANERTFLAWVRTAIAVIAFGFLVERFDLFLSFLLTSSEMRRVSIPQSGFGHVAGLTLIVFGMVMIGVATWRFVRTAREIDAEKLYPGTSNRADLALAALLVAMCAALLVYLVHTLNGGA
jgi:inner membrane protein YidH